MLKVCVRILPAMKIATFLMFAGQAEEALRCYVNLLPNSSIESLEKYDANGGGWHYLMGPANYGFSQWFCWLQDRWGVSWQFNRP